MENQALSSDDGRIKIEKKGTVLTSIPKFLKESAHPGFCVLQFIFKLGALVSYLLLNIFISNLVMTYLMVIIFLVFDFWVTKNLTGRYFNSNYLYRILVGLRWWSEIKEDGSEEWVFESLDLSRLMN